MSFHYKFGGSTAKRTLNCPGWAALADTIKREDKSSPAADRGTMLHTCCEILEEEGIEYEELLERKVTYGDFTIDQDLLDEKVIPAMEALEDFIEDNDLHTVITEELLEFNEVVGGTPDILAYSDSVVACADYKFGDGVMVYAENNDQMFFCVWLALDNEIFKIDLDDDTPVKFAIIQPTEKREEPLDVWTTTVGEVEEFGDRFMGAVVLAEASSPGENLCEGSWCKFCPGAAICPQKGKSAREALALIDNKQLKAKDTDLVIPVLDLNQALDLAAKLEPWIKDVRSFAFAELEAGVDVPDWKLVDKRATRKWIDPDATAEYLKRKLKAKNAMVSKVVSPAQAEKAAKKLGVQINLKGRTVSTSSGTTMVPATDKREAVVTQKSISETLKRIEN